MTGWCLHWSCTLRNFCRNNLCKTSRVSVVQLGWVGKCQSYPLRPFKPYHKPRRQCHIFVKTFLHLTHYKRTISELESNSANIRRLTDEKLCTSIVSFLRLATGTHAWCKAITFAADSGCKILSWNCPEEECQKFLHHMPINTHFQFKFSLAVKAVHY